MALRRELHGLGLRYRLHVQVLKGLRRRPDIVFGPAKLAVFVHGCFWHSCSEHGQMPTSNGAWWAAKLARNSERDRETAGRLQADGWTIVTVWEHEPALEAAQRIATLVKSRRDERVSRSPK